MNESFINNAWFNNHQRRVCAALRNKWHRFGSADLEDACQNAVLNALERTNPGDRFTDEEGFVRWLVFVADRHINTVYRRSKRRNTISLDADPRLGSRSAEPDDTEQQEAWQRNLERAVEALSKVTPLQYDLFNARYRDDLTIREIQERHGYSTENSAKQAVHKAREAVRKFTFRRAA